MQQYGEEYNIIDDYQLQGELGRTHVIETQVLYETDDQWSDCVDLMGYRVVGLLVPELDAGATTFQLWVSDLDDTDYAQGASHQMIDPSDGSAATIDLGATPGDPPQAVGADALKEVDAFRWVKIYLSRSQTADRTFQWVVKG